MPPGSNFQTHTPAIHQQFWKIYHCPTVGGLNPIFTQNRDGHHQSVKEMGTASKLLQMPILDGLYVDHCRFSCMYPQCSSCITKFIEYTAFLVGFTLNIKVKPGLNTWKALSTSLLDYMFELCFTSYLYLCFYVHAPFRFTPWSTRPLFEKYILNNKPSSCLSFQQINVVLGYKIATCSSNTGIVNSTHTKLATTLVGLSSIFCGFTIYLYITCQNSGTLLLTTK